MVTLEGTERPKMFFQKSLPRPEAKPLYGVNLGGWLLLEKWMTPSVFAGTEATDEYTLSQLEDPAIRQRIKDHRDNFITAADFAWLQLHGIQAVRLPIGYWVFGDEEPYTGAIEYVDKAFRWAEENDLKILLDMHGAPGSQNGQDHSGRLGDSSWSKTESNIIKTLAIVDRLAKRYKDKKAFLGLELLNEPSPSTPRARLLKYYAAGYKLLRAECGEDVWVVFSDNFKPGRWKRQLKPARYPGMFIDRHEYQLFSRQDKQLDILGHLYKSLRQVPKVLDHMSRRHPLIIGEWSVALDPLSLKGLNDRQTDAAYRAYAAGQLIAYEDTAAWFYWSYKTEGGGPWSFRDTVEKGWLPNFRPGM